MPALHELQRAFAAALFSETDCTVHSHIFDNGFGAAERMRIYRNTFVATVTAALRLTYPAVDRLVGHEFFDAAAEPFIHVNPPVSAYLNEYGEGFADFLAQFEPTRTLPYLADVARFEWALSVAANAIDAPTLEAGALAAVAPEDHSLIRFEAHPSVSLLALEHPANHIADAVMSGDDAAMTALDASSDRVRLIVHRGPDGVESQRLDPAAYDFLSRLCAGEPLARLLANAPADAAALIAEQLTKGRLSTFRIAADMSSREAASARRGDPVAHVSVRNDIASSRRSSQ
jgi:hypothetical protein